MGNPKWCHICSGSGIDRHGNGCLCRFVGEYEPLNIPQHSPNVNYIAVAPDDHAEMVRKADLYNDCKAVIERLSNELEDLKRRFK